MTIEKDYTTAYWVPLLQQNGSDLPLERLTAWIEEESRGFPQAHGACTEVGIFQIDLQDGPKYGATMDNIHTNFCSARCEAVRVRDLTDDEEQLQVTTGLAMVRDFLQDSQSRLSSIGASWSDDDLWCFVKLHHGLPVLKYMLAPANQAGQAGDWGSFRSWVCGLSKDECVATGQVSQAVVDNKNYWPFDRFFDNAEAVGYLGAGGLSGGGGISAMGKALLAVAILFGVLYYGGSRGLV